MLTFLLQYDIYISFCSKFVLGQKLPFALSELSSRKERSMYYIEYTHPLTFDGRASKTHGWVLFETGRFYFGLFRWVMFDRANTPTERCFIIRKSDGMPRS